MTDPGAPLTDQPLDYLPTDSFFGRPWFDQDVPASAPQAHRAVHGGFEGTDTRFTVYLPDPSAYAGRLIHFLEGGTGGHERVLAARSSAADGLALGFRHGAVVAESNQGHFGTTTCRKAGDDPTIYGFRANAEVTRLAGALAEHVYGRAPDRRYLFGGSGGGKRTLVGLENVPGLWDGGVAWIIANGAPFPTTVLHAGACNAVRLLGDRLDGVIDAIEAGGSGDPFAGLDALQAEALADMYHLGYPRGAEHMLLSGMHLVMFCWEADNMAATDPEYFRAFWAEPGYVGHDRPELVAAHVVDLVATVASVVSVHGRPGSGLRLEGASPGARLLGAALTILDGPAAGRRLYCNEVLPDATVTAAGSGQDGLLMLDGVRPGDRVQLDNRRFLAWCYYPTHHVVPWLRREFSHLTVDGVPIHPQRPQYQLNAIMGPDCTGAFTGKLIVVHNAHDSIVWPGNGVEYVRRARLARGDDLDSDLRVWWNERAEHMGPNSCPPWHGPATTRLVDFGGSVGQALARLIRWVEDGTVPPPSTRFEYDGAVRFPALAAERGGLQPVVTATADGARRAEVRSGGRVELGVQVEVPPGAGTLVSVAWDLDASGGYATAVDVPPGASRLEHRCQVAFDRPGTWFPVVRVGSHPAGTADDPLETIWNLARVRVVVSPS